MKFWKCKHFCGVCIVALSALLNTCSVESPDVLIIQDEKPQMEVLTHFLQEKSGLDVAIVDQDQLPEDLSPYKTVILYVHGRLEVPVEKAVIRYTETGGKFIALHHSISGGKSRNEFYFDFLGIRLDDPDNSRNPVEPGAGYAWLDPITLTLVNLNPNHYITNHNVKWVKEVEYVSSDFPSAGGVFPTIDLEHSEVYMNHKFTDGREKTVLCGFKFFDERNGHLFMQDRAVWYKSYKKGIIFYFMPGHTSSDYENPNIAQMILNAINWPTE